MADITLVSVKPSGFYPEIPMRGQRLLSAIVIQLLR